MGVKTEKQEELAGACKSFCYVWIDRYEWEGASYLLVLPTTTTVSWVSHFLGLCSPFYLLATVQLSMVTSHKSKGTAHRGFLPRYRISGRRGQLFGGHLELPCLLRRGESMTSCAKLGEGGCARPR